MATLHQDRIAARAKAAIQGATLPDGACLFDNSESSELRTGSVMKTRSGECPASRATARLGSPAAKMIHSHIGLISALTDTAHVGAKMLVALADHTKLTKLFGD